MTHVSTERLNYFGSLRHPYCRLRHSYCRKRSGLFRRALKGWRSLGAGMRPDGRGRERLSHARTTSSGLGRPTRPIPSSLSCIRIIDIMECKWRGAVESDPFGSKSHRVELTLEISHIHGPQAWVESTGQGLQAPCPGFSACRRGRNHPGCATVVAGNGRGGIPKTVPAPAEPHDQPRRFVARRREKDFPVSRRAGPCRRRRARRRPAVRCAASRNRGRCGGWSARPASA